MKHPLLLRLASYGFSTGIFFLAITASTVFVLGTSDALKSALHDSGVYDSIAKQVAKQVTDNTVSDGGLPLDTAEVQAAATASFSSKTIETDAEKVIDGSYDWLEGKTEEPEITIDLKPYVDSYTQKVSDQVAQHAQALPPCTTEQLSTLALNTNNIADIPCLPPGVSVATIQGLAVDKLLASNDFLKDPVISTDSLPTDKDGQTVVDRAKSLPLLFQLSVRSTWFFVVITIISALGIVLLTRGMWKLGAKRLGRPLLVTGCTLLVLALATRLVFSRATQPDGIVSRLAGGDFKDSIISIVNSLQRLYTGRILLFAVIYIVIGIVLLILVRLIKTPLADTGRGSVYDERSVTNNSSTNPHITDGTKDGTPTSNYPAREL
jgi:hypothetical protein